MLKSTYRPAAPTPTASPLPPGWTEHKAPTGHTYYYNASTGQSTYTRPAAPSDQPLQIDYGATEPDQVMRASMQAMDEFNRNKDKNNTTHPQSGHFTGGQSYQDRSRRRGNQGDRPKSKAPIPNCAPWVLVQTKLGRRFVHNTETKQSLWKFPQDVMMAVIEMDRMEWEAKKKEAETEKDGTPTKEEPAREKPHPAGDHARTPGPRAPTQPPGAHSFDHDSDSYEEVEVTDDEGEGEDEGADEHGEGDEPSKRRRLSHSAHPSPPPGPLEFNEDDIAWQLAQMEAEDDGEAAYEHADGQDADPAEEDEEGLPLTEEDTVALFRSLLDDSGISPYATFEKLIEDVHVVEDPRYVSLPTTSARKEAFSQWSKDRIAQIQALKRAQESERSASRRDPRVEYLRFLHKNATPKLYWPEFKRKFRRAPEMGDRNLQDKERERTFRDLVAKLKLSESERRKELVGLLKDTAQKDKDAFKRAMEVDELPDAILRDVKFYTLEQGRRDELVRTFLETM
ncbi:hypothetical protein G647_00520 [Cladophialophora carrionii CBS 160.54]|uniref:WW domain-containing protein n=1 Tax=Cladophialophora carrionii CBS 160.54 TaxID=1279043 RepID=V9DN38_9EURO|nr:uncharacterized protein G647_00520 [Cladophialophora carrionii CBS 160.54]ETI28071.1 hypothetical protein G647_00520 [Cladophialophora carrionii CBS 160.54]